MEFLIVFGFILIVMVLIVKNHLKWEVDENSCNIQEEEKAVKNNKLMCKIFTYIGIALMIVGIVGIII